MGAEPSSVFGAYDVRGRYPEDFSPAVCRRLADALVRTTPGPWVVARDVRRASELLERAVVARAAERARPVLKLGIQPTPLVGFASQHLAVTGIAFTPSHNPVGFAGLKAFDRSGRSLGTEWRRVRAAYDAAVPDARLPTAPGPGRAPPVSLPDATRAEIVRAYLAHVSAGLATTRTFVVDGRGGATSRLAPRALNRTGARVYELHPRFSPTFHGLSPEPTADNVGDLRRAVRERGADLGVAFDGDGDRVVFVDERGQWVEPEVIGTFLFRNLSPPGRPLVVSVDALARCESIAPTVRSRVGGRYLTQTMQRHGSVVGFEASGHYYLRPWGPNSDGILTACVLGHLLDRERTSLGRLRRDFGPVVRERAQLHFGTRAEAVRRYRELRKAIGPRLERAIDGFHFHAPEGSVLLRLSNTQPTIRVLLEPKAGAPLGPLRRTWRELVAAARGARSASNRHPA